ncbi:adhesion G protein-coupled receptor B3 isoform X12 [Scyliorhinus canicula]|uniref:adhesion G protein-coupled receptor B3 isoform X12 n=1 Tax=Scyliorhinus canicula TaxID=7830 RepID=UPI0018F351F2|nr:adhesion G protein-coupled receptor B3 isoform X12 [Scyliorhinus canicula]
MKALGDLMTYVFAIHLLAMVGFNTAHDLCSSFVKGVIYGSYSLDELFPQNFTNCTWTLENPDPTKYTIYLKFSKRDQVCSDFSLWAYQFDHYSPEKIRELLASSKSVVHLCQARSMFVFLEFGKNFIQLRRLVPGGGTVGQPRGRGPSGRPAFEFLVLNKVSPSEFGCQVLCGWLESCVRAGGQVGSVGDGGGGGGKASSGAAASCGVLDAKCNCQQDVMTGVDGLDMVLPLNADTEGCLSARLHNTHTCNLTEGKRTSRKGLSDLKHFITQNTLRSPFAMTPSSSSGDPVTEEWTQWSMCSVTCGQGSQVRTRACVSSYGILCSVPLRESRVCNNTALCPVHGVWEDWSPWSLCSFTCGRGQRTRSRSCVSPQYGGRVCDGPESQTKICNIALCPVDGQWKEWSPWTDCSVTCSNGTQQRTRQCTAAAHGGSECRGHWAESRECFNADCTENGKWNPWGHWSGCSKSCDGGWQRRIRVCQGLAVTGKHCEGLGEEIQKCSEQRCPAPYEICGEDYLMAMVWRRTAAGDFVFNRCPLNATGTTSRRCSLDRNGIAYWEEPSFARCISNEYRYLQHTVKEHLAKGQRTLAGEGMSQVTKTLLDLTQRRNFYGGDLLACVEILRNVTDTFKRASYIPSSDDVQNFFQIISNLLEEENREKWEDAQQIYPGSVELMQIIEDFIHVVGMGMMDFHNSYLMTGNLVASIHKLPAASVLTDINFPMKGRKGMVDWARNSEDKIIIPKNIFIPASPELDDSVVFVLGTIFYKNLGLILPSPRNHTVVNSKVIAVTVRPKPQIAESVLEIELAHLANGTYNPYCALWDFSKTNESTGAWSTLGCKTVLTDASHTKCLCDRLSTFAILAYQPTEINMENADMPSVTLIVGCGLSCMALIALAVVYAVLWRYIRSERSIILINFCFSIISSNILIVVGQTQTRNKGVCTMTTALLHFFFLASFCWVLTEAWQSYMAVTGKIRTRLIRKRFLCLGWGLPALVVAISMGFTKAKGYGTSNYCWLSLEGGLLYAFVGPAAAVVLVNMVIGILVFNKLVSRDGILDKKLKHRGGQMSEPHSGLTLKCSKCGVVSTTALSATTASNAMASLWSSCVVLPLLALTWMSAVLAMTDKRSILFQILFAVFDSLQGFVIVMVHCVLRREVQDAVRCRLRNCQDPIAGDTASTFPNGHARIMPRGQTDFEKDVDIACRSDHLEQHHRSSQSKSLYRTGHTKMTPIYPNTVLHKDIGSCRAATITGTLSRISLNDDDEDKGIGPEGVNFASLPGNIISKVLIQQPPTMHVPIGMNELTEQCLKKENSELRRTVYLCTDDNLRAADAELAQTQERRMESDYIVMPRGSANLQPLNKDESKLNITREGMPLDRLMHFKVNPEFNTSASVMDHITFNLDQHLTTQEHKQNIPFEPRSAVKNFIVSELDENNTTLSRSETGSTVSMSSLERRKSRYSDLDFEKVMHTRKRHMELFQELNQKFQTLDRFREPPNTGSVNEKTWTVSGAGYERGSASDNPTPSKHDWDVYKNPGDYQHYSPMNVLDAEAKEALELRQAEWEKCLSMPLDVQEGDFQTEV